MLAVLACREAPPSVPPPPEAQVSDRVDDEVARLIADSLTAAREQPDDALGARVSLCLEGRRLTRAVRAGGSYCASSDPRAHFGLGSQGRAESVIVRWLDGSLESFGGFDADRTHVLRRGEGSAAETVPTCS